MADEKNEQLDEPAEIESLNEKVLNTDEANLDELEGVSGGKGSGTTNPDGVCVGVFVWS